MITIGFSPHRAEALPFMVRSMSRHQVIVLENPPDLNFTPMLNGDDLKQMGVPAGRKMGRMLRELKYARLDGRVATEKEEQELIQQWLSVNKR